MQLSVLGFDLQLVNHGRLSSLTTRYLSVHIVTITVIVALETEAIRHNHVMQTKCSPQHFVLKSSQMRWSANRKCRAATVLLMPGECWTI